MFNASTSNFDFKTLVVHCLFTAIYISAEKPRALLYSTPYSHESPNSGISPPFKWFSSSPQHNMWSFPIAWQNRFSIVSWTLFWSLFQTSALILPFSEAWIPSSPSNILLTTWQVLKEVKKLLSWANWSQKMGSSERFVVYCPRTYWIAVLDRHADILLKCLECQVCRNPYSLSGWIAYWPTA